MQAYAVFPVLSVLSLVFAIL